MSNFLISLILYMVLFVLIREVQSADQTDEKNAMTAILTGYNKLVRPTKDTIISLFINFIQIVSVEEKTQTVTTISYLTVTWEDTRLAWNKSSYNELEEVFIPIKSIWTPDICIINQADGDGFLKYNDYNYAIVENDGTVFTTISLNALKTRCKMDVRKFPYDSQSCTISIGAWSQSNDRISVVSGDDKFLLDDYTENSVWSLISTNISLITTQKRLPSFLKSYNLAIDEIELILTIKRRPLYFMINGIFPCLLLNILTILFFFLPYSSQVGLSISSILTYSVYSLKVASDIPIQSEYIPIIGYYFIFVIVFILIDFLWFIYCQYMLDQKHIPKLLELYAENIRGISEGCCNKKKNNDVIPTNDNKEIKTDLIKTDTIKNINNKESVQLIPKEEKHKCDNCDLCKECQKEKDKEIKKKKDKEILEANVKILNLTAFTLILILQIICNLAIWIPLSG